MSTSFKTYYIFKNYFKRLILLLIVCACVHAYVCVHRNQKRMPDLSDLELQAIVGHPAWVQGTEPRSSSKTGSVLSTETSLCPSNMLYLKSTL